MNRVEEKRRPVLPWIVGILLDAVIVALLTVVVAIVITGGGTIEAGGLRVRARTIENPILILAAIVALRYATAQWSPFLGVERWGMDSRIAAGVRMVEESLPRRAATLFQRPVRAVLLIAAGVFVVKALLAWSSPGFFSGDDVEIHEMSLSALLEQRWPIWELRSAFFPMLFIYPAQRLAMAGGAVDPAALVFAGRLVVAVLSTAVIPLTWLAARRLAPADPRLAAVAVLFVSFNKLLMSFGSSELPRPVATVFVVGAFLLILRPGTTAPAAAGALIGVAAAFRFSELVFLPAALLTLGRDRFLVRATVLLGAAAIALAGITAVADALYWGRPFSSVAAAVDYTLVQRLSSRGYEPLWEYLALIPAWTTFLFVGLAIAGTSRQHPESWWLWTPIALLSLLPHKESRYLIPVIPFFSIAAARGLLRTGEWMRRSAAATGWRRWARELFAPALVLSVLHDMGGWRLVRSNEGVRLAESLRASPQSGVAAQDLWRLGGRPYLWRHEPLVEIPPELLDDPQATAAAVASVQSVALRARTGRTVGDRVLPPLGFERAAWWRGDDYVLYVRRR